jgi:transcriptional regulator
MYTPKHHDEPDLAKLHALIRTHALGVWVIQHDGELIANHLPFDIDSTRGEFGTLVTHVARANPVWKMLASGTPSLAIFQGPEAYITPSWYPGKYEHGKVVPTWNYAVVHARGTPTVIEDRVRLMRILESLTDQYESTQKLPWKITDAPPDYIDALLGAIVGIEIPIASITGKWKMHQHRSDAEKLGVVAGLMDRGDDEAVAVAQLIRQQFHL